MDATAARTMFTAEHHETIELARSLSAEQWELPSLCEGWTVRDVMAHLARHIHPGGWREGIEVSHKRAKARERSYKETAAGLIQALAAPAPSGVKGLASTAKLNTCELVVHQQDVRRVVGLPRECPAPTLVMCLAFSTTRFGTFGVTERLRSRGHGLRLRATDVSWAFGHGPEVSGPGEALLMALAGRRVALGDLTGPGVTTLAERLGITNQSDEGVTQVRKMVH
jgi:uncharacterized protein (TIGR03083 family)